MAEHALLAPPSSHRTTRPAPRANALPRWLAASLLGPAASLLLVVARFTSVQPRGQVIFAFPRAFEHFRACFRVAQRCVKQLATLRSARTALSAWGHSHRRWGRARGPWEGALEDSPTQTVGKEEWRTRRSRRPRRSRRRRPNLRRNRRRRPSRRRKRRRKQRRNQRRNRRRNRRRKWRRKQRRNRRRNRRQQSLRQSPSRRRAFAPLFGCVLAWRGVCVCVCVCVCVLVLLLRASASLRLAPLCARVGLGVCLRELAAQRAGCGGDAHCRGRNAARESEKVRHANGRCR